MVWPIVSLVFFIPQNIDYPPWCFSWSSEHTTAQFSSIQYYMSYSSAMNFPLRLDKYFLLHTFLKSFTISYTLLGSYGWHVLLSLIPLFERSPILEMWDLWNWMLSNFYHYVRIRLSFAKLAFLCSILSPKNGVVYQALKAGK